MARYEHWIDGAAVAPAKGRYLVSYDPRSGLPLNEVADGSSVDVDMAVAAAVSAAPGWRGLKPVARGRLLHAIADALRANSGDLAALECAETGKPAWQTPHEIEGSAGYFEYYAGLVNQFVGEVIDIGPEYRCYTVREPFGVVGVITPWNAPLNQAARAVAPAIAAGNTVVVKPSEFTSATTLELARLASEAGLPRGVLNVVTGTGEAGSDLVAHPGVRKVAFTGSIRAGRDVGRIAAERIIPLTLELGGKSANVVFADADLDAAVAGSLAAFALNAGQVCTAGTRLLVESTVHDAVVEALVASAAELRPGEFFGPQTTAAQFQKVQDYFAIASQEGARLVTGGGVIDGDGWFVQPTIYTGVANDMRVAREEIFGPVLVVLSFDDEDAAVSLANDSDYGLAAGVWTTNLARAHRVASRLEAGQVFINEWQTARVETPFGGYKQSGYGREKGIEALHHYTQTKCVTAKL